MCREKNSEGIYSRCTRICFNATLVFAFIFFVMIIVLHSYTSNWNYLLNKGTQEIVEGFSNFFIVMFAIFYFVVSLVILRRYCSTKRLCRLDNCSFYILTTGIFVLGIVGRDYVNLAAEAHNDDFKYSCAELALADGVPKNSLLAEINQVYHNAESLLCTAECPCAYRSGGTWYPTDQANAGGDRMLALVTDPVGPTNVRKCATYNDRVYSGDEDKLWQYEEVFMAIEEDHDCSGICLGIDEKPYDYHLFSNVNDGVPLETCRKSLYRMISNNIAFYGKLYLVAVIMSGTMLGLLIGLLAWQIHVYCQKKCGRKGPSKSQIRKNRAKNGMVVGGDDQESEEVDSPDKS